MYKIIEKESPLQEGDKGTLFGLYETIFGSTVSDEMRERLAVKTDIHLIFAINEQNKAIGFKIGFREDPETFYSWLGGVLPDYRGQGIAKALMEQQHAWCQHKGYAFIRTKTMNRWKSMLILNIRMGFEVIGVQAGRGGGELKIILEKKMEVI
jgi:GNAT superfamily N-acetyltransferase